MVYFDHFIPIFVNSGEQAQTALVLVVRHNHLFFIYDSITTTLQTILNFAITMAYNLSKFGIIK